ncbi:MAG: alpha/beta fold hydrolase, partial [Tumebacillaceae bacterium]
SWTFAGHSTGGMIGLAYAVQYGDALDALVVVGSAASRDYHVTEDSIYNRNHPKYLVNNGYLRQLMEPTLSPEERKEISRERTKLSLFRPERYDEYFTGASYKVMNAPRLAYFDRHAYDVREQLPALQTKTLIICGAHDVQCPLRYSIDMHERLPGSELVVFEESNHYPFLEEQQKFADTIKRFFDIA